MKNNLFSITFILTIICNIQSCFEKEKGCMDPNALNRSYSAEEDDGSCLFSNVTFYASAGFFNGIPITKIDISVEGNGIGNIPGTYYPSGPGNCSAQGTAIYQFLDGETVDWNSTVYLASGAVLFGSGQVSPSSVIDCIKVNVTK